jgi:hypothetical protein
MAFVGSKEEVREDWMIITMVHHDVRCQSSCQKRDCLQSGIWVDLETDGEQTT